MEEVKHAYIAERLVGRTLFWAPGRVPGDGGLDQVERTENQLQRFVWLPTREF
jgi:hypothetical protein